jgi:hypothetical protein
MTHPKDPTLPEVGNHPDSPNRPPAEPGKTQPHPIDPPGVNPPIELPPQPELPKEP